MSETAITLSPEQERNLAAFYWSEDPARVEQRVRHKYGEVAAFIGLTSSVRDLAKIAQLHLRASQSGDDTPLVRAARRMREPQVDRGSDALTGNEMGLGWFRETMLEITPPKLILFHTGRVPGHAAVLALDPAEGFAVIVLQNLGGEDGTRAVEAFAFWLMRAVLEERAQCHG